MERTNLKVKSDFFFPQDLDVETLRDASKWLRAKIITCTKFQVTH